MTSQPQAKSLVERLTTLRDYHNGRRLDESVPNGYWPISAKARDFHAAQVAVLDEALAAERELSALRSDLKRKEEALEKLIHHFEDGEQHDEGAFDPACADCVALSEARAALTSEPTDGE